MRQAFRSLHGQGAIESSDLRCSASGPLVGAPTSRFYRTTARSLPGQGATEYLVLLAVVLVIALVAVALLGTFSGTAGGVRAEESQAYWRSTSPIAVVDASARNIPTGDPDYGAEEGPYTLLTMVVKNSGPDLIRLSNVLSIDGDGWTILETELTDLPCSGRDTEVFYDLAPGDQKVFHVAALKQGCEEPESGCQLQVCGGWAGALFAPQTCSYSGNSVHSPSKDFEAEGVTFTYTVSHDEATIEKTVHGEKALAVPCS